MKYLYSTQPFIARCLSRFFYRGKHYVYAAPSFYPYRLRNPRSSNPFSIYQDLYEPWRDRDPFDKVILQTRINLKRGVVAKTKGKLAAKLDQICNRIDIVFFYPIVYRIPVSLIKKSRRIRQNSGLKGSSEYLIADLDESVPEFEILFLDYQRDKDFETLINLPATDRVGALKILLRRSK